MENPDVLEQHKFGLQMALLGQGPSAPGILQPGSFFHEGQKTSKPDEKTESLQTGTLNPRSLNPKAYSPKPQNP